MLALHVEIAVVTNVELDHHATYGSLAEVREVFRALLAGAPQAVLWDRPDVARPARRRPRVAFDVPAPALERGGSRFDVARARRRAWPSRAPTTRATPPPRWRPACWPAPTRRRPPRRWPTSPAPAGASRPWDDERRGARVVDDYAHHPTEVAADDRRRPARWAAARRRGLPAAPVLAHRSGSRASSAPRWPAPTSPPCSTSTRRASAPRTSPASPGCSWPRRPPTRPAGARCCGCRPSTPPSRSLRGLLRDGDLCLVLGGRGDVDELGRARRGAPRSSRGSGLACGAPASCG